MYYIQMFMYSLLVVLGIILAVVGDTTIGIIGASAGITCIYLNIIERRNQPRRWS